MAERQSSLEGLVIKMFNDCYSGKKVIVTGHTGFKGSWLCAWLQKLGAEVVGVALEPNSKPSHFELLKLDMESHLVDIRDYKEIHKIFTKISPDVVFHLAAQPLVRDSYNDPLYTFGTNVIGTANVLNACRELDMIKAVVIVTTDKCYENKEWVWGYRENDPMGGHDPYSASKGCAELVVASYRDSFFNLQQFGKKHNTLIASARAGNVIGGGDWSKDRLIPDIIEAAVTKNVVQIRNPNATRPWQHVLECLSGYLCLGEKLFCGDAKFAEAWNFAPTDDGTATVLNVVKKIKQQWPLVNYAIQQNQDQPHEANLLKLDCSKANAILQWKNVWDLAQTISVTTEWYKAFHETQAIRTLEDIERYISDAKNASLKWVGE